MRSALRNRYNSGLTMIELMLVVTIASILLAVSIPGFQDMISRMSVNSQVKTLRSALNYARSEAVRMSATVIVCPRDDSWADGWEVRTGGDCDGELLRLDDSLSGDTSVSSDKDPLVYDSMGFSLGSQRQFVVCPGDGDTDLAQAVDVSASGRVTLVEEGLSC